MKPVVAIVGRPNVGKSTLFNRISGAPRALVDDMPGVTRDRLYNNVTWNGRPFVLIDTGGFEPTTHEPLLAQMRQQTQLAIEEADVIVFLLDARDGLTASDRETAELLRRTAKPVHYVVNKVDGERHDALSLEFFQLGPERLHAISAQHGRGVSDFLDDLTADFREEDAGVTPSEDGIRVAVVGRPNVGKSSLVNRLCGHERALVSPIPGTTRDALDTEIQWYGKRYVLIDTAGIRRKFHTRVALEKYAVIKALKGMDRCNVAVLMLDVSEGITSQDAAIAQEVVERARGCVILANKWDLVSKDHRTHDEWVKRIHEELPHVDFAPVLTISALTGLRVSRLLSWVEKAYESCGRRVSTSVLNDRFQAWLEEHHPPLHKGRRVKLYYASQAEVHPPVFVVFANAPEGVTDGYRRYLIRRIREDFQFVGATVRIHVRPRGRR